MPIADTIYAIAHQQPDAMAIICGDKSLRYKDFSHLCRCIALVLHQRGVGPGDRILLIAGNSIYFAAILVAVADLGAVLAPVSPSLSIDAFIAAGKSINADHIISPQAIMVSLKKEHDAGFGQGCCLTLDVSNFKDIRTGDADDWDTLESAIAKVEETPQPFGFGASELPFILTMTSGSTGAPKPIILTQGSKIERANALSLLYDVSHRDIILAATPMYHSLAQRLVLAPLLLGAVSVVMPHYSPKNWLDTVESQSVSFTIIVSSQIVAITRMMEEQSKDQSEKCLSLRALVSSSATLKTSDKKRAMEQFSCAFYECYGASEIAIATSLKLSLDEDSLSSVGFAAPNVDIQILSDDDQICRQGEIGQIACKTPMLFGGYFQQAEQTERAMLNGYFKTGDLGRIDEEGALHFCGRIKDLIIVGGINVYPPDIESVVLQMQGVFSCAAFSVENANLGEAVGIAIVKDLTVNESAVTARTVRLWCMGRLADFQFPQRIVFVDALPANAMGKLMRGELTKLYGAKDWEQAE